MKTKVTNKQNLEHRTSIRDLRVICCSCQHEIAKKSTFLDNLKLVSAFLSNFYLFTK